MIKIKVEQMPAVQVRVCQGPAIKVRVDGPVVQIGSAEIATSQEVDEMLEDVFKP